MASGDGVMLVMLIAIVISGRYEAVIIVGRRSAPLEVLHHGTFLLIAPALHRSLKQWIEHRCSVPWHLSCVGTLK